jgi:hypothetical protein
MEEIIASLKAIPAAAASPLALIAYLATVGAWTLIAWRVRRHAVLLAHIQHLPLEDRIKAIQMELGYVEVPKGLSAEQYLRSRIHSFVFSGFVVLCAALVIIAGMAFYKRHEQSDRADNLIRQILGSPASSYMSAVNTLSNGRQMIAEAAGQIRPPLSKSELDDLVDRMAQQRMTGDQINQRLQQLSGTDRLRRSNDVLTKAAASADSQYKELADCFRNKNCEPGAEFSRMCAAVRSLQASIDAINSVAGKIPSVMMNASGAPSMFGGGSMDIDFQVVSAENIKYLATIICGNS